MRHNARINGRFVRSQTKRQPIPCGHCGELFTPDWRERFCSHACGYAGQEHNPPQDPYYAATFEEIGRQLGISSSRADQLYRRALAKMRAAMGVEQ